MVASLRIRNFWGFLDSSTVKKESQAFRDLGVALLTPGVLPILDIEERCEEEQRAQSEEGVDGPMGVRVMAAAPRRHVKR